MAKLFVSYSRRDSVAARKLIESFKSIEQQVWVDWESIPPAVDWLEQIFRGIEEADAFIFLISPDSIASEVCKVEINRAAQNNKRIIPIVLRDVKPSDAPENIRKLNWTFMRETDNFEEGLAKVKTAIELDLDWLEEHRRLQVRALEWHRRKDPSLLLHGRDLRNAYHMIETATSKDPIPTDLQKTYILYSRKSERNRTIAIIATGIAVVIMAILSYTTWQQSILANQNADEARKQEVIAVQKADEAETERQKAEAAREAEQKQRENAEAAQKLAEQKETEAKAQRSAARAQIYLNRPGELYTSTLLAIDSMRRAPSDEAEEILRRNISILPLPVTQFAQAGKINDLAFNPDGNTFVTASADGTVCEWKIEEDAVNKLFCTPENRPGVNVVLFNPDGSSIITGDQAGLVQILDPENGTVLHAFQRAELSSSRQVQMVEVTKEDLPGRYTPRELPVRGISIRPTRLQQIAVAFDDGEVPLFDANTGRISSRISAINRPNVSGLSPNGAWLVIGSENGRVTVWKLSDGDRFSPSTHRGGVLAMAFSPKANKIVTAGGDTIAMTNLSMEKELYRIPIQSPIRDISFSPNGSWFVTGSDDHLIRVWDTLSGNEQLVMSQNGGVTEVVVSSDGRWIATTGDDKTARVWDAETGAEIFQISLKASGSKLAFCNDDKWLVSTDESGAIAIWDISKMNLPKLSIPFNGIVEHVQYSPSGERMAVSSEDKVWLLTPDPESILKENALGQPIHDFESRVKHLIFSHDSKLLGILTEENEIGIFNLEERNLQAIEVSARVQSIAFSPDSQELITSDLDGNIQAWNALNAEEVSDAEGFPPGSALASTGELLAIAAPDKIVVLDGNGGFPMIESSGDHALLIFSQDGSLLASSNSSGEITIFQQQGDQFIKLTSFVKAQASSLAFDPDGTLLAVGTTKIVYLMDPVTGKELARIPHMNMVNGVSFSADGNYLATTSSQTLQFWAMSKIQQIQSEDLIPTACVYLFENFSLEQWQTFFGSDNYELMCKDLPEPQE